MSYRFGAPRNAGAYTFGVGGLGIRGSLVPASGLHGPPVLQPTMPAEAADEFRYRITTRPLGLTFFRWLDNGEIQAEGPPGVHVGAYEADTNGIPYGANDLIVAIGAELSGAAALDGVGAGGGLGVAGTSALSGAAALDGVGASGGIVSAPSGTLAGAAALDGVSAGGGLASQTPATLGGGAALAGVGASGGLAGVVGTVVSRHVVRTVHRTRRVTSMGTARQVPGMDVAEAAPFEFDFTDEMVADGTTIESFVVVVDVRAGVDSDASALLQGEATRDGHVVRQVVKQHAEPVDYAVRCEALGVNQQRYTAVALVASRRL